MSHMLERSLKWAEMIPVHMVAVVNTRSAAEVTGEKYRSSNRAVILPRQ